YPRQSACTDRPRVPAKTHRLRTQEYRGHAAVLRLTSDSPAKLDDHNAGRCPHTARYRLWQLHVAIEFPDEQRAISVTAIAPRDTEDPIPCVRDWALSNTSQSGVSSYVLNAGPSGPASCKLGFRPRQGLSRLLQSPPRRGRWRNLRC